MPVEFNLKIPHETAELVKNFHPDLKSRIKEAFRTILQDPCSGKALKEELKGLRSYRIRKLRIIYRISSKKTVDIIAIGPRKNIYEETFKLISRKG